VLYKTHIVTKIFRHALRLFFKFDRWHTSPLSERLYAIDVISFCNSKSGKKKFIEIGCGLGDIILNVNYEYRFGYDNDIKALNAANFLKIIRFAKNIKFELFSFPENYLKTKADVLVMVNWIHHIEPATLKTNLCKFFYENIDSGGCIIIDTVQDKDYPYNHDITYLTKDLPCTITKIGNYIRQREVWCIKKVDNSIPE
jgi:hypothetical protein